MTTSRYLRSARSQAALQIQPSHVRDALLEDPDFRSKSAVMADVVLSFDRSDLSIQRSELFDAIRALYSGSPDREVADIQGRTWRVSRHFESETRSTVRVDSGSASLNLGSFDVLSPEAPPRLAAVGHAVKTAHLPTISADSWRQILAERPLDDDEVPAFSQDVADTPGHAASSIATELDEGRLTIATLVPRSRTYFERLIGEYDGSASIAEYASSGFKKFQAALSDQQPYEGLLYSLLVSSHSSLTSQIRIDGLDSRTQVQALEFIAAHGDLISQLGSVEVGLAHYGDNPALGPSLRQLVVRIREATHEEGAEGFHLLSSLFQFVYGELAHIGLLATDPPFYRRLAALSQAALIYRELRSSNVEVGSLGNWAVRERGAQYFMQCLVDMRLEPRWHPELGSPQQLKAEFVGRITLAATVCGSQIVGTDLYEEVLGDNTDSLRATIKSPDPYFPGPLEGNASSPRAMPQEVSEAICVQLRADSVSAMSFVALINSQFVFPLESSHSRLAADTIRRGSHRLSGVKDREELAIVLDGLALVAAETRGCELAAELRIMARGYSRGAERMLSVTAIVQICLVSAASHADLSNWVEFVGDWLTELAFGELTGEESALLAAQLDFLCRVVPELWTKCGRAHAALAAHTANH